MSMLTLSIWPGALSGLLLFGGFAKTAWRAAHDQEDTLSPGDVDAAYYLSTGRIVWNSDSRRKGKGRRRDD